MKNRGDADAGAEVLWVGGDGGHCLGRCLEQQAVHRGFVLERDVGDLGGQREDDVEVTDRQQVGLALGQPGARGRALAPGTVLGWTAPNGIAMCQDEVVGTLT